MDDLCYLFSSKELELAVIREYIVGLIHSLVSSSLSIDKNINERRLSGVSQTPDND